MSAAFSIQQPVVVATLPRPIIQSTGRYVTSDVYGGVPGLRKKKRSELAVGIDGEGVNIYNIQSSKLITSYALPPQSSFTCPPCSLRLRKSKGETERRTYVSTKEKSSNIILFQEVTVKGTANPKTISRELQGLNAVVFLSTVFSQGNGAPDDLLVVRQDGEILCLRGDTLGTIWTSPASTTSRGTIMPEVLSHNVEFAKLTDAYTANKGLLRGRSDVLSAFPEPISADGFNPALLIIITSPADPAFSIVRTLHVLPIPREARNLTTGRVQSLQTLLNMALPWLHRKKSKVVRDICYNLHVTSGVIHELSNGWLTTFNLTGSLPRIQSQLFVEGANSFLPLSSTSIITSSEQSVNVYHPTFRSIQASINLNTSSDPKSKKRKVDGDSIICSEAYRLITYSPKQGIVYAIKGNDLAAFQIESRNDIPGRRSTQGLLIDSLGLGFGNPQDSPRSIKDMPLLSVGNYVPGRKHNIDKTRAKVADLDQHAMAHNIEAFERIMAKTVGLRRDEKELETWKNNHQTTNGVSATGDSAINGASKPIPRWLWPAKKSDYPNVDPFWAQYAISKVFNWPYDQLTSKEDSTAPRRRLLIEFFPHNVVNWLIETGNLNKATIELALRKEVLASGSIPAGQIIQAITDVDPEMKILLSLLTSTLLDAPELLHAIKILMQSLELFGESPLEKQHFLANEGDLLNGDIDTEIELEEAEADEALQVAEYHLEDGSSIRGQALSLALAKLHACPATSIVRALQATWTLSEIASLIYLLRFELARGAWTSRYLDTDPSISHGEAGQDSAIILVADLLNSCVDAIGAGGWLSGDAILVRGDQFESEELIASLKLEVSAALEGIEEATYLKGLTAEIVRYGELVQKALPSKRKKGAEENKRVTRPIMIPQGEERAILPMGLKASQHVSRLRVGAGGEVYTRSMRDIGRLKSRKVGKYTRERIVI